MKRLVLLFVFLVTMSRIDYAIPSQAYELIRDRIGEILTDEVANQIDLSYDVDLNAVVLIEDRDPIDKVQLNAIVVSLATGQYSNKNQGSSVDGGYLYFIDIYTNAKERFNKSGSYRAATIAHKLSRYVRCILEHQEYKTLGYQPGFVMRTGFVEFNIRDVSPSTDSLSTYMIRMVFKVDANEITNAKVPNLIDGYDTRVDVIYQYEGNTDTDESCECEMNADFTSDKTEVEQGSTLQLFDQTDNYPTDWLYTISGPVTLRSYDQNPIFTLNTLGTYNAKLMAAKDGAGDIIVKSSFFTVVPATSMYEPEAVELFDRMNTAGFDPSSEHKEKINDWFVSVKNAHSLTLGVSNVATLGDCKWFFCGDSDTSSRINWIKNNHHLIPVSGPSWASLGYTFNGVDQYLKTNYTPGTQGVAFLQNDASMSWYMNGGNPSGYQIGGYNDTQLLYARVTAGGFLSGTLNSSSFIEDNTGTPSVLGKFALSRINGTQRSLLKNGSSIGLFSNPSIATPPVEQYIGCINYKGTPVAFSSGRIVSAEYFKGNVNHAAIYAADQAYLTYRGAAV